MTSHRPHPITGPWPYRRADTPASRASDRLVDRVPTDESRIYDDPEDAVLYDGCARCTEHAQVPLALDPDRIGALWRRMVEVERDPTCRAGYRTAVEGDACRWLYRVALLIERTHPMLDPWVWPWHARFGDVSVRVDGSVRLTATSISIGDDTLPMPGQS